MNSLHVSQNGVCPFITYMQDIYLSDEMSIHNQSYCQQPLYYVDTTKSLYNVDTY